MSEENVTAAALRGAAEEAVALKKNLSHEQDYPAVPSTSFKDKSNGKQDGIGNGSQKGSDSGESACLPTKRPRTASSE